MLEQVQPEGIDTSMVSGFLKHRCVCDSGSI